MGLAREAFHLRGQEFGPVIDRHHNGHVFGHGGNRPCSVRSGDYQRSARQVKREGRPGAGEMVGEARFELTTFCTQNRRATRLRYTPT